MPTLNEYTDRGGYYIRAHAPEIGNITYQLSPQGRQIVEKVGYRDGDDIGWQVINALKIPGFIYTENSEKTDDDISADLNGNKLDVLSEEDAKQLLDELSSVPQVGGSQSEEIGDILGVSLNSGPKPAEVAAAIDSVICENFTLRRNVTEAIDKSVLEQGYATGPYETKLIINSIQSSNNESKNNKKFELILSGLIANSSISGDFTIKMYFRKNNKIYSITSYLDSVITPNIASKFYKVMSDLFTVATCELGLKGVNLGIQDALPEMEVTTKR